MDLQRVKPHAKHFYPRPPRGGRLRNPETEETIFCISIHALRGEGDAATEIIKKLCEEFLSTPSAGRATAAF